MKGFAHYEEIWTRDVRAVSNSPCCHLRAMSGSVAPQPSGSLLMAMARVTTKGYADAPGLGCHLPLTWTEQERWSDLPTLNPLSACGRLESWP